MFFSPFSLTEELQNQGVQEVFVFCTRGELNKYRVPSLLDVYQQRGFTVHHMPFPDGDAPELEQCCQILEELQVSLENNRRTVIQWVNWCFVTESRCSNKVQMKRTFWSRRAILHFPVYLPLCSREQRKRNDFHHRNAQTLTRMIYCRWQFKLLSKEAT